MNNEGLASNTILNMGAEKPELLKLSIIQPDNNWLFDSNKISLMRFVLALKAIVDTFIKKQKEPVATELCTRDGSA